MSGRRDFRSLVDRRTWLRSKLIGRWWHLRAKVGLCNHPAQVGPAGGDMGWCLICKTDVPWDLE